MMTKQSVLHQGFTGAHRLKKLPHMWTQVIVVVSLEARGLGSRFLPRLGIVFLVPFLKVRTFQACGKCVAVITGREIDTSLRNMRDTEFRKLDESLRSHESRDLGCFRAQRQTYIHWHVFIFKQHRVYIGRVAAILPAIDSTKRGGFLRSLVDPE